MDFDNSASPGRFFTSLVRELKSLAISNIQYFKDGKTSHHAKFHVAFCLLFEYLDLGIEPCFREISKRVHEFDASPTEKGNGYRSLLRIVQKCCLHLLQISRHVSTNRESMLFRRAFYMKELEAYVATLGQLRACLYYAQKLMNYCQAGYLFADEETLDDALAEQLMTDVEMLSQDCFYGRCLGFQFCESMQRPLNAVAIAMASFSEGYQENSQIMKVATSLFNSGKYIMNPDLRAQQVVNVTRTADIQFCKAFWSITETDIMHQLPSIMCPTVQVDDVFHLGPDAFDMPSADGSDEVTITPPCAHTGPAPVQVRLISYQLREGQEQHVKSSKSPTGPRSPLMKAARSKGLLVHCHGGGFVAQSSRSHEVYLRHWAKDLGVPILSIDYSLAPESPFPRALEECFYAYAWAVHNCHKLGSTGEVIVLAGDSAGANLMVTTTMRAASFNIRQPDGILGVYTPVLVRYTPSPARLLCLMDPLLPAGILSRCLAAYAGVSDELSSQLAASVTCHIESSAATLRLSSQEAQDSDWVVVSQDSAARTNTTLASSQASGTDQQTERKEREGATDEVEIFSRPRTTGGTITSMVSGATDKLVSYVGTYSHLLPSFSSTAQAPEQIPLMPVSESGGPGIGKESAANPLGSSIDDSPCTPSFHTPMATPNEDKAFRDAGTPGSPQISQQTVASMSTDRGQQGEMVEISLENELDQTRGATVVSSDAAAGNRTPLEGYSALQDSLPTDLNSGNHDAQFSVGNDPEAFSIVDQTAQEEEKSLGPQSYMPSLTHDKVELLQLELDSSAASNTPSTTLPSSLMSTPSDELDSYEILDSGEPNPERPYISPGQKNTGEVAESSQSSAEKEGGPPFSSSSASLSYTSAAELQAHGGGNQVKEAGTDLNGHSDLGTENAGTDNGKQYRKEGVAMAMESSDSVDAALALEPTSDTAQNLSAIPCPLLMPSSPTDGAGFKSFSAPLLSPDSGCLSDEADKLDSSVTSSVATTSVYPGPGIPRPGLSRENLHLNLNRTASTSSASSLPRSASQPVIGDHTASRSSHSMSPSDFKRERHLAQSPLRAIRNIPIVKNPYMSPLLAPDWLLEGLPHVCLVACHLDPLLDDSVMFTRRLRSLGKSVDLVLLDDLPHGFLNFSMVSRDAKQGSDLCVAKLKQLLRLDEEQKK